ncbi:MAG TPA: cbb3-type cytochrome c oxidase subunit 3 [Polyangiaceae bacterium LLY-WYZ-14_1]|jgi:cbb3-type cytochrome oxidase subunit 3|nr:cbb3-type cytochrome c oxidase subunit 3 [Polyangiaceae bacterium LLY-WYZ-14_1]
MDAGPLYVVALIASIVVFAALVAWAFLPKQRRRFQRDKRIPLEPDPVEPRE